MQRQTHSLPLFLLLIAGFFGQTGSLHAQPEEQFRRMWKPEHIIPLGQWRYHTGDNPAWADPDFDDSDWQPVQSPAIPKDQEAIEFPGIGWFRVDIAAHPTQMTDSLMVVMEQKCALELFYNGRLIYRGGRVSADSSRETISVAPRPRMVSFHPDDGPRHVLALRMSNHKMQRLHMYDLHAGAFFILLDRDYALPTVTEWIEVIIARQWLTLGALLALALLHFMLFVFYPSEKGNLYYAIYILFLTGLIFSVYGISWDTLPQLAFMRNMGFRWSVLGVTVFSLRFVYEISEDRLPKVFWVYVVLAVVFAAGAWFLPIEPVLVLAMVSLVEVVWRLIRAIRLGRRELWIVLIGTLPFAVFAWYAMLATMFDLPYIGYLFLFSVLLFLASMSVYLARSVSRTNMNLEKQITRVKHLHEKALEQERQAQQEAMTRKLLEAEIERKKLELKEERKLRKVLEELEQKNRELHMTQAQLIQSEKMASLGTLVAGIAHEINTPIGAVHSMRTTLFRALDKLTVHFREKYPEEFEQNRQVKNSMKIIEDAGRVMESGTDRVATIVRRLRTFARLDQAELQQADIHDGIEDTLLLIHHELKHGIKVVKEFDVLPAIHCYPGQLNQVFLNLFINAQQAMEGRGTLTIITRHDPDNRLVTIKIEDTGKGIDPNHLERIFDPGFTTKGVGVGTGLGLSICYNIVQQHKGEIKVESEVGRGSAFTVILPTDLDQRLGTAADGDGIARGRDTESGEQP
ncbi:hypothetical protein GF324_09825 [bacterium]|nr:hypothetical protein [bacterium]